MVERYDQIGKSYARRRQPDPRIAAALNSALGDARTVLNVGAGAGAYEPADARTVVAVEPSEVMIRQRPPSSAPVVRGRAESLPFRSGAFDAVMGILTLHHWQDKALGLSECARVCARGGRLLFLTIDIAAQEVFWLFEYWPEILELDHGIFPALEEFHRAFTQVQVLPVPIPSDCVDGFLGAFWRRPDAYLDPTVRAAMSGFVRIDPRAVESGCMALRKDLVSGDWRRRNTKLAKLDAADLGYRLVVCEVP